MFFVGLRFEEPQFESCYRYEVQSEEREEWLFVL